MRVEEGGHVRVEEGGHVRVEEGGHVRVVGLIWGPGAACSIRPLSRVPSELFAKVPLVFFLSAFLFRN